MKRTRSTRPSTHAAGRHHAGAADHLPDYDSGGDQVVQITLPIASNIVTITKPENVILAVDKQGNVFWNDAPVGTNNELLERLKMEAVKIRSRKFISAAIPTYASKASAACWSICSARRS